MLQRHIQQELNAALQDNPVVLLRGARQVGKSTLVRSLPERRYLSLDDISTLTAARTDPTGFITSLRGPITLDEIQRAPDLALAIKSSVDQDRTPGRFLLTGSVDVLATPALSDSLAGRVQLLNLWSLSQGEILSRRESFLTHIFSPLPLPTPTTPAIDLPQLTRRIIAGGFPEMLARTQSTRREAWFDSYLTTVLQRDVRELANIRDLTDLPRLLSLLATRAGNLLETADLSRNLLIPPTTLRRYTALLEHTFLIRLLPAWFTNLGRRLAKSPKLVITDPGLHVHLLGADPDRFLADPKLFGPVLENFVVTELLKQQSYASTKPNLFHYRTHAGEEVDIVLENRAGHLVGIEVKATSTPTPNHFKSLKTLAESAGNKFLRGILLHTGPSRLHLSDNLSALPISDLWDLPPSANPEPDKPAR